MNNRKHHFPGIARLSVILAMATIMTGCGGGGNGTPAPMPPITNAALTQAVTASRAQSKVPALFAAVIDSNSIVVKVDGVRKLGAPDLAQTNDRVHLGSNTKAMTSTLIAMYVEQGQMTWDMKLTDIFPEYAATMRPEFRNVTVAMLLEMRGGVLAGLEADSLRTLPVFSGTPTEQRHAFTGWILQQPPDSPPGTYNYSNGGYVVAAAILERVSGKVWDNLLQDRLLRPLGITTMVYGWPAANGAKQPWGHLTDDGSTFDPLDPEIPENKLPHYLAPAGDLSMSMGDYAKFVQMNLRGLRGQQTLLRPETIKRLHTPPANGSFALGWAVTTVEGVPTSFYVGSLEPFLAEVWLQPSKDRAVAVVTNTGTALLPSLDTLIAKLIGSTSTTVTPNATSLERRKSHMKE